MLKKKWAFVVLIIFLLNACNSITPEKTIESTQTETITPVSETTILAEDEGIIEDEEEVETKESTKIPPTKILPTKTPISKVLGVEISDIEGTTIEFWHIWTYGDRAEGMLSIADEFNAENKWGIFVELDIYENLEDDFRTAIQSGESPNVVLAYPSVLASWYITENVVDINTYLENPVVGLTEEEKLDLYQSALDSAMIPSGFQVGFPISLSTTVLFYNKTWAEELGYENAPQTSEELKEQACAAAEANNVDDDVGNDGTGGMVFYPGVNNIMSWIFAFGDDGLTEDGTGYDFTSQTIQEVAIYLKEMWDEGCTFSTETYPNPEFATRKALFTMRSSADLHYQLAAFDGEGATDDEWVLIAFPGPDGNKAINTLGQTLGIVDTTPEENLAAWLFLKYFMSSEAQATWVEYSGFYPVRNDIKDLLEDNMTENPQWSTGIELLEYGQVETSMSSWGSVRWSVFDAFKDIVYSSPEEIPLILEELNNTAVELGADSK